MRLDGRPKGSQSPSQSLSNGSNGSNGHSPALSKATNGHTSGKLEQNGHSSHSRVSNGTVPKLFPSIWQGHSREEVTRLLIQGLSELGYQNSARALNRESGFELETPNVSEFRSAILDGRWDDAELLLLGEGVYGGEPVEQWRARTSGLRTRVSTWNGKGLALVDGANPLEMLFQIRQQKYLELLEERELHTALAVLRAQLTPHAQDTDRLHALGVLLMCSSPEDVKAQADWDGANGDSRHQLLSCLSIKISPRVMIPENRLSNLLHQVKDSWIERCLFHNTKDSPSLYSDHRCDRDDFPYRVTKTLSSHEDEIWYLAYSHDGRKLATAGKDRLVLIYDVDSGYTVSQRLGGHTSGVSYLAWSPDDTKLITCTRQQDSSLRVWEVATGTEVLHLDNFENPPTAAAWMSNSEQFIVGSLDIAHALEIFNIYDEVDMGQYITEDSKARIYDLALTPDGHRLVAMSKTRIYVFDTLTKEKISEWDMGEVEMTSITISEDGKYMLVSINPNRIQLMSIDTGELVRTFEGHKQEKYLIRSAFGGAAGTFVISGSEDQRIYIWRTSGHLVEILQGHDSGCVNAVAWHPTESSCFASAGDDGKVKIWSSAQQSLEYLGDVV